MNGEGSQIELISMDSALASSLDCVACAVESYALLRTAGQAHLADCINI